MSSWRSCFCTHRQPPIHFGYTFNHSSINIRQNPNLKMNIKIHLGIKTHLAITCSSKLFYMKIIYWHEEERDWKKHVWSCTLISYQTAIYLCAMSNICQPIFMVKANNSLFFSKCIHQMLNTYLLSCTSISWSWHWQPVSAEDSVNCYHGTPTLNTWIFTSSNMSSSLVSP